MQRSKTYRAATDTYDQAEVYAPLAAIKIAKGSPTPHTTKVAKLTKAQVREIAEVKQPDLNANDIEAASKIIAGTARSMGITVED